jgi:hypothetical protein
LQSFGDDVLIRSSPRVKWIELSEATGNAQQRTSAWLPTSSMEEYVLSARLRDRKQVAHESRQKAR